jgi:hypothetical protein
MQPSVKKNAKWKKQILILVINKEVISHEGTKTQF